MTEIAERSTGTQDFGAQWMMDCGTYIRGSVPRDGAGLIPGQYPADSASTCPTSPRLTTEGVRLRRTSTGPMPPIPATADRGAEHGDWPDFRKGVAPPHLFWAVDSSSLRCHTNCLA
jgi:hypothetical protein